MAAVAAAQPATASLAWAAHVTHGAAMPVKALKTLGAAARRGNPEGYKKFSAKWRQANPKPGSKAASAPVAKINPLGPAAFNAAVDHAWREMAIAAGMDQDSYAPIGSEGRVAFKDAAKAVGVTFRMAQLRALHLKAKREGKACKCADCTGDAPAPVAAPVPQGVAQSGGGGAGAPAESVAESDSESEAESGCCANCDACAAATVAATGDAPAAAIKAWDIMKSAGEGSKFRASYTDWEIGAYYRRQDPAAFAKFAAEWDAPAPAPLRVSATSPIGCAPDEDLVADMALTSAEMGDMLPFDIRGVSYLYDADKKCLWQGSEDAPMWVGYVLPGCLWRTLGPDCTERQPAHEGDPTGADISVAIRDASAPVGGAAAPVSPVTHPKWLALGLAETRARAVAVSDDCRAAAAALAAAQRAYDELLADEMSAWDEHDKLRIFAGDTA